MTKFFQTSENMKNKILSSLKIKYPIEASTAEFKTAYEIAKEWMKGEASIESKLWFSAMAMLCGKLNESENIVNEVLEDNFERKTEKEIALFLKESIKYDRFERMPGEISTPFVDVEAAKAFNGYFWATKSPMHVLDAQWSELIVFLNHHLTVRNWRVIRNLKAGQTSKNNSLDETSSSDHHLYCINEANKGEIIPALALASFFKWSGNQTVTAKYLEDAYIIADKDSSLQKKAEYLLVEGDVCSAPFSSPVLWNFAMQTPHFNLSNNLLPEVEKLEFQSPSENNLERAKRMYKLAESIFLQLKSARGLGHLELRYGYLGFLAGEYKSALKHTETAHERFIEAGDFNFSNLAKTYSAVLLTLCKNNSKAKKIMTEVALWGKENGQFSWTTGIGHIIGRIARHFLLRKSDVENALNIYLLARDFQLKFGNNFVSAQLNIEIANLYERIGHHIQATNLSLRGLSEINSFFEHTAHLNLDTFGRTMVLNEICNICYYGVNLGIQKTNPIFIEQWLNIAQRASERLIDSINYDETVKDQMIVYLREHYESLRVNGMIVSNIYKGTIEREIGNLDGYNEFIKNAEQLLAKSDLPKEMAKLLEINIAVTKDEWKKAQAIQTEYILFELEKSQSQIFDKDFNNLSVQFLQENNDYQLINRIFSLLVRIRLYREAKPWYEKLNNQFGDQWWMKEKFPWMELVNIAEMWEGLNEISLALEHYDQAFILFEQYRNSLNRDELKIALYDMRNMVYAVGYATRCAFKANQPEKALVYVEGAKARALLDLMQENRFYGKVEPDLKSTLFKLREKDAIRSLIQYQILQQNFLNKGLGDINALNDKLVDVGNEIIKIEEHLQNKIPDFFNARNGILQDIKIQEFTEKIAENALLLSYFFSGDELFIWAIDHNGLIDSKMIPVKDWHLKSMVYLLRDEISNKSKKWKDYAIELSQLLLEPVVNIINSHRRIIFVLHSTLHGLPVHILPFGESNKPLGISHIISYLPATAALNFVGNGQIEIPTKALFVGNPTLDLKGAELEANYLSTLFPESREMLLLRENATQRAVKQLIPLSRLLHFATHGNISEDNPMTSSLSLANGDDLSVHELMGLEFNADLVVLSACNSGRGNQTAGDDLLGLSRALVAGGTRAAVLTYWPVDDIASCLWMRQFYLRLKNGDSAAMAAQVAQAFLFELNEDSIKVELDNLWDAIDPNSNYRDKGKSPLTVARDLGFTEAKDPIDYKHPYFWGAYSVFSN